jgi:hypothetical protein
MPLRGSRSSLPQTCRKDRCHRSPQPTWVVTHPLEYETVLMAGKAGVLLSGLSADEQLVLSSEKVEAIRKAAGVMKTELPELLRSLSGLGVINVSKGNVEVLGVSAYAD